jgi:hypothetical protein
LFFFFNLLYVLLLLKFGIKPLIDKAKLLCHNVDSKCRQDLSV